jgi:hypothetical protein
VYKTILEECKSVDSSAVEVWRKGQWLKITGGDEHKNIYNAHETGLFRLPRKKTLHFKGDPCNAVKNSKDRIRVLLACTADGMDTFLTSLL